MESFFIFMLIACLDLLTSKETIVTNWLSVML